MSVPAWIWRMNPTSWNPRTERIPRKGSGFLGIVAACLALSIPPVVVAIIHPMTPLPRGSVEVWMYASLGCGAGLLLSIFAFSQMTGLSQLARVGILVVAFLGLLANVVIGLVSMLFWALSGLPGP